MLVPELIRRYVPGAGLDDYAAYVSAGGERSWPIPDPLGSVIAQVDAANAATQINRYDEYGVPQAGFSGPFGFNGALSLPEAVGAPWHLRNRQYHPALGRFLQTDPIGYLGGMNLYAYVGGDPVNRVDPWGLDPWDVVGDVIVTGRPPRRSRTSSTGEPGWLRARHLCEQCGGGKTGCWPVRSQYW